MTTLWNINVAWTLNYSLFRNFRGERLEPKDAYKDLFCPECRKVDEFAAISRGITLGRHKPKKCLFGTMENFTIISTSLVDGFPPIIQEHFQIVRFSDNRDYAVIYPKIIITPNLQSGEFVPFMAPCIHCKRYEGIHHGEKCKNTPFQPVVAIAYGMELNLALNLDWYVNDEVAGIFRSIHPKVKGLYFSRSTFLD